MNIPETTRDLCKLLKNSIVQLLQANKDTALDASKIQIYPEDMRRTEELEESEESEEDFFNWSVCLNKGEVWKREKNRVVICNEINPIHDLLLLFYKVFGVIITGLVSGCYVSESNPLEGPWISLTDPISLQRTLFSCVQSREFDLESRFCSSILCNFALSAWIRSKVDRCSLLFRLTSFKTSLLASFSFLQTPFLPFLRAILI